MVINLSKILSQTSIHLLEPLENLATAFGNSNESASITSYIIEKRLNNLFYISITIHNLAQFAVEQIKSSTTN